MRRLTLVRDREQGAIATIVAMLFFFGIMLALGALTVDVGNINADRRQLQNGADAVALAVAQQCVADGTCKVSDHIGDLRKLANANAADSRTAIRRVDGAIGTALVGAPAICGTADGLEPCPTSWAQSVSNLQECPQPSNLPATVKYVRVYTETEDSEGNTILPYYFGAAIAGVSGANQQTCALVGIGPLGVSPDAMPIVVARCAYDTMLAKNTPSFPPMPPSLPASQTDPALFPVLSGMPPNTVATDYAKYVMTLWAHISGGNHGPSKCDSTTPSGLYLPGGFGWVTTDGNQCTADFTYDKGILTMPVDKGASAPEGCKKNKGTSPKLYVGTTIYIPIMTGVTADKNSYIIDGLAGFYVAGYSVPAADPKSYDGYKDNGAIKIPVLNGGDDGVWGWFTDEWVPSGSFGTTGDPTVPKVIGTIG